MKAEVEVTDSFVIIHFKRGATISPQLFHKLKSEKFDKLGAKGSNDFVAVPHPTELEFCKGIAERIAEDYNKGKYPDILRPKIKVRHG